MAFSGVVPDPDGVSLLLEHPVARAPSMPTESTTATYLTHFDLTEISLLNTGDVLPDSF